MARLAALATLVAVLAGGCSAGGDEASGTSGTTGTTGTTTAAATTATTTPPAAQTETDGERADFATIPQVIAEVEPSVVTVAVRGAQGEGSGSGVIWDEQGRIVTNNHVVAGAQQIEVVLASGARLKARVIGTDPRADLAVIDVDRDGLPAAEFATDLPRVGDLAIALGSPLGLTNTASAGIVSALHRDLPSGGQTPALVDLLQTDAAISPGNSGGALVDAEGRIMGINVAYIPPQAQAVSIGFAIPAPTVLDTIPQLIENGRVEYAYLGVRPTPVTEELSRSFDLGTARGALVQAVPDGTPAARAGIEQGDVIVALDGKPIDTVEDLYATIREYKPGETATVTVVRNGGRRDVEVRLGTLPG